MDFKESRRLDGQLNEALDALNRHIDALHDIERKFLFIEGNKKAILATLTVKATGKSHAERETQALASIPWRTFCDQHSQVEADYNQSKRRYTLLVKAYDAAHLSLKTEVQVIRKQL